MNSHQIRARLIGVLLGAFLVTTGGVALAQDPDVQGTYIGTNAASNEVLDLQFPDLALQLNADTASRASLQSIEWAINRCDESQVLVAADTNRGQVLVYEPVLGSIGDVICDASSASCPARPVGISVSEAGVFAAGDNGTGGLPPAVWVAGAVSGAACPGLFEDFYSTGQIRVCPDGPEGACTPATGVEDTVFVTQPRGGFSPGDLIVATPNALLRYTAEQVRALRDGFDPVPLDPEVLVAPDANVADGALYTGLAFIPGTGGADESEQLLLTTKGGGIRVLTFTAGLPSNLAGSGAAPLYTAFPTGNGNLGVDAERVDGAVKVLVADRQQGKFLLFSGDRNPANDPPPEVIASNAQQPSGTAINGDAFDTTECADTDQGCLLKEVLRQFYGDSTPTTFAGQLIVSLNLVPDDRFDGDTFLGGELFLGDTLPTNVVVPGALRGIQAPDGNYYVVVVELTQNSPDFTDLTIVEAEGLIENVFANRQGLDCSVTGLSIFYHPNVLGAFVPSGNSAFDLTVECLNPPRKLSPPRSLVLLGDLDDARQVLAGGGKQFSRTVQRNLQTRINELRLVVENALPAESVARVAIESSLDSAEKRLKSRKFGDVSAELDAAAVAAFCRQGDFVGTDGVYPEVLGRALSASRYAVDIGLGRLGEADGILDNNYRPPNVGIPSRSMDPVVDCSAI